MGTSWLIYSNIFVVTWFEFINVRKVIVNNAIRIKNIIFKIFKIPALFLYEIRNHHHQEENLNQL